MNLNQALKITLLIVTLTEEIKSAYKTKKIKIIFRHLLVNLYMLE